MELSNLRHYKKGEGENAVHRAVVDVTTGSLWWKRTEAVKIARGTDGWGNWYFADTGEYLPESEVFRLWRVYHANKTESK